METPSRITSIFFIKSIKRYKIWLSNKALLNLTISRLLARMIFLVNEAKGK